ncbi:hypothetical protein ONZ43_g1157 [Nemania bipapillata]|uniref:Uncharacterized protein n=1 Tax=Nemania bipapillata TaxID=110536 RepID=A0ACC2J5M5_9PEZI|nr:hypothetical protein ONZ43_g1157 [Nemania bipapillata]
MGGGPRVPYPKHVWSPAGGWYAQPANWKRNTAMFMGVIIGITALTWKLSAELEHRPRMPEPDRFFPSRYWSKQIREHEAAQRAAQSAAQTTDKSDS